MVTLKCLWWLPGRGLAGDMPWLRTMMHISGERPSMPSVCTGLPQKASPVPCLGPWRQDTPGQHVLLTLE